MSEHDDELPPFTDAHREAIAACRFKTTNIARTWARVSDTDTDLIAATGLAFSSYRRSRDPDVIDHEAQTSDQRVIEYVAGLRDGKERGKVSA